jgi:exosortase O
MTNIPLGHREQRLDRDAILGTIAIVGSWLYCNRQPIQWLVTSILDISLVNGMMLMAGGLMLAVLAWRYRDSISLAPGLHQLPLYLMLGCGGGSIVTQWLVSLTQLSVGLFLLGCYGLLGLYLAPSVWRRGLPFGIAIACLLPFGVQFSTGFGAPARIMTAHIVEWIVRQCQIAVISAGDVILLETGVAYVDLPCSGLKSMWTGTLFLLAATWLEGRQIGWRWLLVGLTNLGLLAIANIARVLILTVLTHVFQQSAWAEILHVPLGVIGFVMASLLTWGLLRFVPKTPTRSAISETVKQMPIGQPTKISPSYSVTQGLHWRSLLALSGLLLGLAFLPITQTNPAMATVDLGNLQWAAPMKTEPLALNAQERKFFASYPGVTTRKQHFQQGELAGTSIVVASPTWQAHHSPELCLTANGHKIAPVIQRVITPTVTARWLSLDDGQRSAIYWFQSPHRTTDDYMSRFWDDVFRRESQWTMVSAVFDRAENPDSPTIKAFIQQTSEAIDRIEN